MTIRSMKKTFLIPLFAALFVLPACELEVGNLNGLDLEELEDNPTPTLIAEASVGLIIGHRDNKAGGNGMVSILGVLGRESYNFDPADPRYRSELLEAPELDPGSPAFGGNLWTAPYQNVRNSFILEAAVDVVAGLSDEEKNAVRGFTKTIRAMDFLNLVLTRWDNGIAIDVDRDVNDPLAPLVTKEEAFQHVADLLDEAAADLGAAGGAFPFALGSGFAGFDTPATFLQVNRAIKARVSAHRQDWESALAALDESFLTADGGALDLGVYHVYSTGAGDETNGLSNPNLYVHPSVEAAAELKPDGSIDDRLARKVYEVEPASSGSGDFMYTSSQRFAAYQEPTAPLPIIRNEELILLRAEAYIGQGQYDMALPDINLIRTASGGLAPLDTLDAGNAIDQLLQQRFYSLLYEGGHRWIDMRRYERLEELRTYDENEGQSLHEAFPIPADEQNARDEG